MSPIVLVLSFYFVFAFLKIVILVCHSEEVSQFWQETAYLNQ